MMKSDLLVFYTRKNHWIPVLVLRNSGKPCICYHPWYDDEGCDCNLPVGSFKVHKESD